MNKSVLVLGADRTERERLCELLGREKYPAVGLTSLPEAWKHLEDGRCGIVILDLDSLVLESRQISRIRKKYPGVAIIGLSSRSFHPELQEVLATHICACLGKPPDPDELLYCLKSFSENTEDG